MAKPVGSKFDVPAPKSGSGRKMQDMVAVLDGIDAETGTLHCTRLADGQKVDLSIRKEGYIPLEQLSPEAKTAAYVGNIIDSKMAQALPAGCNLVLEGVLLNKPKDGENVVTGDVKWVRGATTNKDKLIEGVVTLAAYRDQIARVQIWADEAVMPQDLDLSAFDAQAVPHTDKDPVKPIFGIQPRIVGADGKVLVTIPMQSWNGDAKRPISGEDVKAVIERASELLDEGEHLEVAVFREFRASNNLKLPNKGPILTMARTAAPHGPGEELPWGGGVLAVRGVVCLSPGKYNEKLGKIVGAENDWANDVLASGAKQHVHNFIKGPNGEEREVSKDIDVVFPGRKHSEAEGAEPEMPGESASAGADPEDQGFDVHDLVPAQGQADSRPRMRA